MYEYKAIVTNIVDGDTFDASVQLGFNIQANVRFRLQDIDTPEVSKAKTPEEKAAGILAREFVKTTILNKEVTIKSFKPNGQQGKIVEAVYSRWEAAVILSDGSSLKDLLIKEGLVKSAI